VGHDEKYCRTIDLMRERTSDMYKMQEKMITGKTTPPFNQVPPPYNNLQQQYNTVHP